MRRSLLISILAISSFLFIGCEKEKASDTKTDLYPIFGGYMQFSTDVSTRAQLATDMKDKSFGVIGYQYSTTTNWDAAKALATPSTFYNQEVSCDANGVCTYDIDAATDGDQLQPWDKNYKYSFFAYHPYNGNGIVLSDENAVNTPTLTYTYPWKGSTTVPIYYAYDGMYDLITAEAIDLDGSGNVDFDFKHRLFAVEVLVNNYNENTEGTTDARRSITNMTVSIEGLANSSVSIPLSMLDGESITPDGVEISSAVAFQIQDKEVVIPAFNETFTDSDGSTRGHGVATSISKLGTTNPESFGYLTFIPQKGGLDFKVTWTDPSISDFSEIKNELKSTMEFKAGRLYQIIINYVGSGITIAIIEAGSWDVNDVYHTFE